jgi:hypothetical protein
MADAADIKSAGRKSIDLSTKYSNIGALKSMILQ